MKLADGADLKPPTGWHDSHRLHFLDEGGSRDRRADERGSVTPFSVESVKVARTSTQSRERAIRSPRPSNSAYFALLRGS